MRAHYDLNGFQAEQAVIRWLEKSGYSIKSATAQQNQVEDIDCWLKVEHKCVADVWTPVSIKAMTKGIQYRQIGFELSSDRSYNGKGWFYNGKAELYLIVRDLRFAATWNPVKRDKPYPPRLYWLPKQQVVDYVAKHGWYHTRGLSGVLLQQQQGLNTVSGYLRCNDILKTEQVEYLPEDWCDA